MNEPFEILFEDEQLVAIQKPSGIMVHRSGITEDKVFILQLLRDQLNQIVHPVHRLDRGTSGVLLFAKNTETARHVGLQFQEGQVKKVYQAIIRGYVEEEGTIDYALANNPRQVPQRAVSHYRRLRQVELPVAIGRYQTARYSWVEVRPETGKSHQIRKHFAHIRHPILNDKKYGDIYHNHHWRDDWGIRRLLLHACNLSLTHPDGTTLSLAAPLDPIFVQALERLGIIVV